MNFAAVAEHDEQSVVDAWWQEGVAEGGPNGAKGGGALFKVSHF
jgi:hypothetical protein